MRDFSERKGDQEQAEMFAFGIVPPQLVLVPCVNPQECETHNPKKLSTPIILIPAN
jgi:hypothetical protein